MTVCYYTYLWNSAFSNLFVAWDHPWQEYWHKRNQPVLKTGLLSLGWARWMLVRTLLSEGWTKGEDCDLAHVPDAWFTLFVQHVHNCCERPYCTYSQSSETVTHERLHNKPGYVIWTHFSDSQPVLFSTIPSFWHLIEVNIYSILLI
jgi:hypothetical protein